MDPCRVAFGVVSFCAFALFSLPGCRLIEDRVSSRSETDSSPLRPIVAPRESVHLEILFVDRPHSDGLLGKSLWQEIDQIAGLPSADRVRLKQHGWRVGHASSHPPRALEELLELSSKGVSQNEEDRRLVGRRVALAAGNEFPIEVTELLPELTARLESDGESKTWSNARAILKVRIEREQDGWVRLHFTPEIHHGRTWLRPVATALDWTRRRTQQIEPLYDQQFSLSLSVGEMALVTSDVSTATDSSDEIGHAFFRSVDSSGKLQRLLVVRIAGMKRMTPVYEGS